MSHIDTTPLPASDAPAIGVAVLGSTGSIGVSTLDVIARHPRRFYVTVLTANTQVDRLFEQCRQFKPRLAVMLDAQAAEVLATRLRTAGIATTVRAGADALQAAAADSASAVVVAAIVGAAGLMPTLSAVRAGKRVLLANKEPLVMCGDLLIEEARKAGARLLPLDSEHNAIFQCMPAEFRPGEAPRSVRRIFLTCSGGPFRTFFAEALHHVTPEQACAHPRWNMGRKISVDSATLMNKGLELIEACRLFGVAPSQVEVVIHPQSVVHSMVEYTDGSVLAQLANPDMRIPIAHALAWPDRMESGAAPVDLFDIARLDFSPPDLHRFPCLRLAYEAAAAGGSAPAILNAANEEAVAAFLERRIGFTDIASVIEQVCARVPAHTDGALDTVLADDAAARVAALEIITSLGQPVRQGAV